MLLTITYTNPPATDLGFLLHKNPARFQSFPLSFGQAHVFYPEASEERCTAALLLDMDSIGLVRRRGRDEPNLYHYINDRPYVASSFLSVAIAQVYGAALGGRSKDRPELAEGMLPLRATVSVLPCRGGEDLLRRLFEPLGYAVRVQHHPLDETFPEWGESRYYTVELEAEVRMRDLLSHLYVLVPVLDDEKHYWVGEAEVEKLLRQGADWLPSHPERALITNRYLQYRRSLTREALSRLADEDNLDPDTAQETHAVEEEAVEERISLGQQRLGAVLAALKSTGAKRVVDLGCGEGRLLRSLLEDRSYEEIVGMDVSQRALDRAADRLNLDRLPPMQRKRITLIQGSLMYWDERLAGYDAATVVEVIEHLDPPRLAAFERILFERARPGAVVLTTPNREYNVKWETLPAGRLRHKDHRFEWTRQEFQTWGNDVAVRFGYAVRFLLIGPEDPDLGSPTQMALFTRDDE